MEVVCTGSYILSGNIEKKLKYKACFPLKLEVGRTMMSFFTGE
jgi:hypothetical protein